MAQKRLVLIAWVCFSVFAGAAHAQTLLEMYRYARDNDPKFRGAQFEFRASEQVLAQANAGLWPQIKLEFDKVNSEQRILRSNNPIFGAGQTHFPTNNYTLSLSQPIFRKDLIERLAQAQAVVRQSSYTMLAAEQDLLLRTAASYLAVLAARDSLELARAEKDAVRKQLDLAEGRLKSGLGAVTNLYEAAARYAVDQAKEIEAENKFADLKQSLREITGRFFDNFRRMREELALATPDPAKLDDWLEKSYGQNLALLARTEGVQVAWQEVERQRAGYFPSVTFLGQRNHREAGSTLFGGGSTVMTTDLTLRLSIPVYEGGMTRALTAESVFRHQKSLEDREAELRSVERQTRAAYNSVVGGVSMVKAYQQSVLSQQKALEAKEAGARSGLYTMLMVLDTNRDLFTARRDYAQARYDYLLNGLRLKQAAGTLSEQDLYAIDAAFN